MRIRFDVNDAGGRESLIGGELGVALEALMPEHRAAWGALKPQQMVEHLLWTFEISTGQTSVVCSMPEDWQVKARSFLYSNRPSPQGFENPLLRGGLPPLRFPSIPTAALALQSEARRFLDHAISDPASRRIHPVFGPATVDEWSRAHFKHCVHHLLQFGLIEVELPGEGEKNA